MIKNFLLGCCSLSIVIAVGCNDARTEKQRGKERDNYLVEWPKKQKERKLYLLAIKHEVSLESAKYIIEEYLPKHDSAYMLIEWFQKTINDPKGNATPPPNFLKEGLPIANTVSALSEATAIQKSQIASIIIDYEIWEAARECGGLSNQDWGPDGRDR